MTLNTTETRTAPTVRKLRGRRVAVAVWLILVVALAVAAAMSFADHAAGAGNQEIAVTGLAVSGRSASLVGGVSLAVCAGVVLVAGLLVILLRRPRSR